jgi:hypothetical protein
MAEIDRSAPLIERGPRPIGRRDIPRCARVGAKSSRLEAEDDKAVLEDPFALATKAWIGCFDRQRDNMVLVSTLLSAHQMQRRR